MLANKFDLNVLPLSSKLIVLVKHLFLPPLLLPPRPVLAKIKPSAMENFGQIKMVRCAMIITGIPGAVDLEMNVGKTLQPMRHAVLVAEETGAE